MPGCYVRGCLSRWGRKDEDYSLHVFPKDPCLTKKWLQQLGIPPDEIEQVIGKVKERKQGSFRICSKHFAKDCYEKRPFGWTLKKGSIPTLFLQDDCEPDHAYAKRPKLEGGESTAISGETIGQPLEFEDTEIASISSGAEQESSSPVLIISETITDFSSIDSVCLQTYEEVVPSIACTEETQLAFYGDSSRSKKKTKKRHAKSVGTCTEYFPGQLHKSTQFRKSFGTKNKKSQVCRRPPHRSIGIQCNLGSSSAESSTRRSYVPSKQTGHVPESSVTDPASLELDPEYLIEVNIESPLCSSSTDDSCDSDSELQGVPLSDSELSPPTQRRDADESYRPTKEKEDDFRKLGTEDIFIDPNDPDSSYILLNDTPNDRDHVKENKFIVFESCLDELLFSCKCKARANCMGSIVKLQKYRIGTAISVTAYCSKKHKFHLWRSQPLIDRTPVGNLLLSAGILCSGSNFLRVERLLNFMGIFGISKSTHFTNQDKYLFPTINYHWEKNHLETLEGMQNNPVALSGDRLFHSPRHSAKYCIYSFLDNKSKKMVDFQIEQHEPGTNADLLEKKAFHVCLQRLRASNINIKIVCTDLHMSIRKLMRDLYKDITHQFDVWHVANSIGSKIATASKRSNAADLAHWVVPAKKHLWWCAQTCNQNPSLMREQWISIVYHVANKHRWQTGTLYKECQHAPLNKEEEKTRYWLTPGSTAHSTLKGIVLNPHFLKNIEHLSHFSNAEELEGFHNTALKYQSKRNHYSIDSLIARMQLSALDHNKNIGRMQPVVRRVTSHGGELGSAHHRLSNSKAKKEWVVENELEPTNQEFIKEIMQDVLELVKGNRSYPWRSRCDRELQNIATVTRPDKSAFEVLVTI
ncbi:uncharacterized protein [Aquarana catesbeiana]|uniref:uncharacterized protein isoform X1 n=1 Tax=Aquarana catesbeiana TaxID=8400 RepID=UPI003CC99F82